jgi:hypothetical protein
MSDDTQGRQMPPDEAMLSMRDHNNQWVLSVAYRTPDGVLETPQWKRMQRAYQAACIPVKKKCVAFNVSKAQPFLIADSNAIYELSCWLMSVAVDMDPELLEDAIGEDIEVEVEFEDGPEDEEEEDDWDDIGTD